MKLEFNFVKKGVFDLPETDWWDFEPEDSIEIQPHWTMANIAVEMGLFPSVGQARKNGWDKPIPHGLTSLHRLGKMKKSLHIHNPSDKQGASLRKRRCRACPQTDYRSGFTFRRNFVGKSGADAQAFFNIVLQT